MIGVTFLGGDLPRVVVGGGSTFGIGGVFDFVLARYSPSNFSFGVSFFLWVEG